MNTVTKDKVKLLDTSFRERFFWARQRKGLGANRLSRKIGCAQSLISNIENNPDAKGSEKYNNAFAHEFGVDKNWLAYGTDPQPEGFTDDEVRKVRSHFRGEKAYDRSAAPAPRWATGDSSVAPLPVSVVNVAELQKRLLSDFIDYSSIVGGENAAQYLEVLKHYATVILPVQQSAGQHDVVSVRKGERRP